MDNTGPLKNETLPMALHDYLLTCLIEECSEVIQRATKAQRFGLEEVQPGQALENRERLRLELIDLRAVANLCQSFDLIDAWTDQQLESEKIVKLRKFADYSEEIGRLQKIRDCNED